MHDVRGIRVIPTLIFSKDRACQLDLCLQSVKRNAPLLAPVKVLWTASDQLFEDGYNLVIAEHPDVSFAQEFSFQQDVLIWLRTRTLVCFLMDDDVFYQPLGAAPLAALKDERVLAFCPRLGANCTTCYPHHSAPQRVPETVAEVGYVSWQWEQADLDFGYPGSLDGNVFRVEDIEGCLMRRPFTNPNEMEDALAKSLIFEANRPLLASYSESVLISVPANVVNTTHPNRKSEMKGQSPAFLNDRYLGGERIQFDQLDFSGVHAAHHELPYVLK